MHRASRAFIIIIIERNHCLTLPHWWSTLCCRTLGDPTLLLCRSLLEANTFTLAAHHVTCSPFLKPRHRLCRSFAASTLAARSFSRLCHADWCITNLIILEAAANAAATKTYNLYHIAAAAPLLPPPKPTCITLQQHRHCYHHQTLHIRGSIIAATTKHEVVK